MRAILVDSMVVRVFCPLCLEGRVKPQQSECKSCLQACFLHLFPLTTSSHKILSIGPNHVIYKL